MSYQTGNQSNSGTVLGPIAVAQLTEQISSGNLNQKEQAAAQRAIDAANAAMAAGHTIAVVANGFFTVDASGNETGGHEHLEVTIL